MRRPTPRRTARRAGEFAIGGRRAVIEAIRSGRATRVLAIEGLPAKGGLRAVLSEAESAGVPVTWTDPPAVERLGVRDHQGVAAVLAPPSELDDRGLAATSFDPEALVVILDGIMDPQNLGACGRSAEAAGASILIVRDRRAASLTPAAVRASAGALMLLPIARVTNLSRTIETLQGRGFFVAGLDHGAPASILDAAPPSRPAALVVGAEDTGLSRLVRESCDLLVSIPMRGRMGSLNASAALSVGLFGWLLRSRDAGVAQPGSASDL